MNAGDDHLLRNVTREVLAELLPGLLEEALTTPAAENGNGHHPPTDQAGTPVPQVPAPPVAAVHRPPGWRAPEPAAPSLATPAEHPSPSTLQADDGSVERVDLRTDADLDAFVRSLARRLENPRDRMAILSGRLRFGLAAAATPGASDAGAATPALRIEKGAVTERHVREAAEKGARLVLSPRAVLTPMARDRARSLGVEIEKERRC
ncbi:MAG: hypothetical protein QOG33_777 [Gaiellales bacterium]|jgi:hypothetical protein|nr:hypothetical protein [Gaiellales bacterium]